MHELIYERLYWPGNIAKTRVILDLIKRSQGKEVLVFDYGCGGGGDWPNILDAYPHIHLVGYEPHAPSYKIAAERLSGKNAEIFSGSSILDMDFKADYIVSFSVLEHVYDKRAFLSNAKRLLDDEGFFYLNYDDGHFRNSINLNEPSTWWKEIRVWLHNKLARPMAKIGFTSKFQARILSKEIDSMLINSGFVIQSYEYNNLQCLKDIFNLVHPSLQQEFLFFWMNVETELNRKFRLDLPSESNGDNSNLWSQMASRTILLKSDKARGH